LSRCERHGIEREERAGHLVGGEVGAHLLEQLRCVGRPVPHDARDRQLAEALIGESHHDRVPYE
jgi:hypothetical protein